MKKQLICMAASAVMIFASLTSYAATYETSKEVSTDLVKGMKTVLIYKGAAADSATRKNIVYIDESTETFDVATKFIIKGLAAAEGCYTVRFSDGQSGRVVTDKFYIGMSEAAGDLPMNKIAVDGSVKNEDSTYNIGYTADINLSNTYNSLIVKTKDGRYLGCANPLTGIQTTGPATAKIGIQINGVSSLDEIEGVWLSPRGIN